MPWIRSYFGAGEDWYFIDARGETQGPFSSSDMTNWYAAGEGSYYHQRERKKKEEEEDKKSERKEKKGRKN